MATWTSRTITSTRHEWKVPAAQPWGACIGDINSAAAVACRAYREAYGIPENVSLPDDALRFHVTDDAILISFTVETEGTPQVKGTRLCHETDPATLKECALKSGHAGDHADANVRWPQTP